MINLGVMWTKNFQIEADSIAEASCQGDQTLVQVTLCWLWSEAMFLELITSESLTTICLIDVSIANTFWKWTKILILIRVNFIALERAYYVYHQMALTSSKGALCFC